MIPILYGSQTGTARYVSDLLKRVIEYGHDRKTIYNLNNFFHDLPLNERCFALEMDAFNVEKLFDVDFIIFICSTHGDGTEPFNMSRFWSFLSSNDLPPGILSHLRFAVFGLGDSSYEKYNYCSKRLFNRLKMLGAKPVIRRGSGDSQDVDGFLTDLRPWLQDLTAYLKDYKSIDLQAEEFEIESKTYSSKLIEKKMLTPKDHTQDIMELVFDIPEYTDFSPGDCLSFSPTNYNYKEFMDYNGIEEQGGVSSTYTVRKVADFNSCPHQPFFFALKYFLVLRNSCSEEIVLKVEEISEDYDFYYEYILKPKRTIFEVIKDLQIKIDIFFVKNFIPKIYPRFFSVTRKKDLYHVTAAMVRYLTVLRDPRKSICSEYFSNLSIKDTIHIGVGRSNLYFHSNKLLFLCTGVGISLPRACVNEFKDKEIIVFYGFRYRDKDFLYSEEWNGANIKLFVAASREDGLYIQDVFRKNPIEDIDEYLVFVSGNSRLNKEIVKLFQEVYKKKIVFQSETW